MHGWDGNQLSDAHRIVVSSIHSPKNLEIQKKWIKLCQIPESILEMELPMPQYSYFNVLGVFRYEVGLLIQDKGLFLDKLKNSEQLASLALTSWLGERLSYFSVLPHEMQQELQNEFSIQLMEQSPDNISHFIAQKN